jgi:hypothetical protein
MKKIVAVAAVAAALSGAPAVAQEQGTFGGVATGTLVAGGLAAALAVFLLTQGTSSTTTTE